MTCPGVNQTFTLTKLDKLCADSEKLLQQFLCEKKPDYALNALMNITEELYQEQRRIINKYKTEHNWKNLLPGVDLTLRPLRRQRRYIKKKK